MEYELLINGTTKRVNSEPDTPLLWVLRDQLQLTGTKYGCGIGSCGACTVYLSEQPIRSCSLQIQHVGKQPITTIEGLKTPSGQAIQAAWLAHDVVQCGYCQSGQILSAAKLLEENPDPSDADIDSAMSGNVCRCATYHRIKAAIKTAAKNHNPA